MMGAAPAATVFVVTPREVVAVTLLNHFARYRIPVGANAQVAMSTDGAHLFVAEDDGTMMRLRWFDVGSGTERATVLDRGGELLRTPIGRGAMAHDARLGRLLVLKQRGDGVGVDAYDDFTLRPFGTISKKAGCADTMLASPARFAVVCKSVAELTVGTDQGIEYVRAQPTPGLVGAAMTADGTILLVTRDGVIRRVAAGGTRVETLPGDALGRIAPDGVAFDGGRLVVALAEEDERGSVAVLPARAGLVPLVLRLPKHSGGLLVQGRFAYFLTAKGIQHIDLDTGLVEVMAGPFDKDASPGAVAAR